MRREEKADSDKEQGTHSKEAASDCARGKRPDGKKPDKMEKAQYKADKAGRKLESAREKLASQKPQKRPGLAKKLSGEYGQKYGFTPTTRYTK